VPVPTSDLRVDHPFQLTLAHRRLTAGEMVHASRTFDFGAVGGGRLAVDVEAVQPESTVLRLSPNRPMTYAEIEEEAEGILEQLGPEAYGEVPRLQRLDWLIGGTASTIPSRAD
jgi:hypothetical protein